MRWPRVNCSPPPFLCAVHQGSPKPSIVPQASSLAVTTTSVKFSPWRRDVRRGPGWSLPCPYEGMGSIRLECVSACACAPQTIDAHKTSEIRNTSVFEAHAFTARRTVTLSAHDLASTAAPQGRAGTAAKSPVSRCDRRVRPSVTGCGCPGLFSAPSRLSRSSQCVVNLRP